MKIIFKNVGQGDSIIIQWQDKGNKRIGIVDCNLHNNKNHTLAYLGEHREIEFIILSHPHYDHFSGLRQILNHCEDNGIIIKRFLHTSYQVPEFLRVATKSIISGKELIFLFTKIRSLRRKGIIRYVTYISDEIKDIRLNDIFNLRFLAPSTVENENFLSKTKLFDEEDAHNNAQANWLSTIIKIYSEDRYVLLTSDSTRETLKRVGIQRKGEFVNKLALGQSPHHGAKTNHYDAFWKTKNHGSNTPIVFSVGDNIYKHPSKEAIDFFSKREHGYRIYSTNQVGALGTFQTSPKERKISAYLELAGSEEVASNTASSQYRGDQIFDF